MRGMQTSFDVAVLVGSLRKGSLNRKTANALIELAPKGLRYRIVEIGDLPLFDEDVEATPPAAWTRFREEIAGARALLFVTPEYNRSIPGGLKNALDVGSRPYGQSVWSKKPAGIVSVSPSKLGAFGSNHALRQVLVFLDVPTMQQPEAYVANAGEMFDDASGLKEGDTKKFLEKFMSAFDQWVSVLATQK